MRFGSKCPFCEIVRGKESSAHIVYRGEHVVVFGPLDPATKGHILVVPERHVRSVWDLMPSEASDLSTVTLTFAKLIHEKLSPAGLNIIQSNGAAATQTVPHVHVHLVPRYTDDKMTIEWPLGSGVEPTLQSEVLRAMNQGVVPQSAVVSPEDKRQHLSLIQAVITRMSQASSSAKTWLLPVVVASYGYAIAERQAWAAIIGVLATMVFLVLDANYLKQERSFRSLYDEVAQGGIVRNFSMNASLAGTRNRASDYWPNWTEFASWAIAPFYAPIIVGGLTILGLLWATPRNGADAALNHLMMWLLCPGVR
ncbi:HIT family protein [Clavibacter sp. CFBP 8614]|uniref:HIT family protein n=1 Tax=unclassified Clavibacter TaxID=2626594 RepID=UPI0040423E78